MWSDIGSHADRLSISAIKMYLRCPKQYEFRYVLGRKQKPDLKLTLGSSFHSSAEANYRHKFKKKRDLAVTDMLDVFRDAFRVKSKDDELKLSKLEAGNAVDEGVSMVNVYHRDAAPRFQPLIEPEHEFLHPMPGSKRKLYGFIDLVASFAGRLGQAVHFLSDIKTTKRMFDQSRVDTDPQLTAYTHYLRTTKIPVVNVLFDVMVRGNTPRSAQIVSKRDASDMKRFEETFMGVERGIDAGAFAPVDNPATCSWCGFAKECWKRPIWSTK